MRHTTPCHATLHQAVEAAQRATEAEDALAAARQLAEHRRERAAAADKELKGNYATAAAKKRVAALHLETELAEAEVTRLEAEAVRLRNAAEEELSESLNVMHRGSMVVPSG